MAIERLKQTLEELQPPARTPPPPWDEEARSQLRAAMAEIQEALATTKSEASAPDHAEDAGPTDRLRDFVEHLEEEHPVLSERLSQLVSSLNRIGF